MYTEPLYEPQYYTQSQQHLEFIKLLIASNYPEEWFFYKDESGEMNYDVLLNDFTITPVGVRDNLHASVIVTLPENKEHPVYTTHAEWHSNTDSGYYEDPDTGEVSVVHSYKKALPLNITRLYPNGQATEDEIPTPFYICNLPIETATNPSSTSFEDVLKANFPNVFETGDQTTLIPHPNAIPTNWIEHNGNFARLRTHDECVCRTEEMDIWFNFQTDIASGMPYVNNNDVISIMTPWHFDPCPAPEVFNTMVNREHYSTMIPKFNKPDASIFTTGYRQGLIGTSYPRNITDPKIKTSSEGTVYYSPRNLCPLNQYWEAISSWSGHYAPYRLWRFIEENFGTYTDERRAAVEKAPYEGLIPNPDQIITGLSEYVYQTQDFSRSVPGGRYSAPPMKITEPLPVLVATMDAYWSWKIHYVLPLASVPRLKNHSEWHRAYGLPYTMNPDLLPFVDLEGTFDDTTGTATFVVPQGTATVSANEWKRLTLLMAEELTSNQDFVPVYTATHKTGSGKFESTYKMVCARASAPDATVFDDLISGSIKLKFIYTAA